MRPCGQGRPEAKDAIGKEQPQAGETHPPADISKGGRAIMMPVPVPADTFALSLLAKGEILKGNTKKHFLVAGKQLPETDKFISAWL